MSPVHDRHHGASPLARAVALPATLVASAALTLQTKINGELAAELGSGLRAGVLAAVISFGSGLVLLTLVVASRRRVRTRLLAVRGAVRARRLAPWQLLGGTAGAAVVASQGLTVGTIGVALFTVAIVAGQTSTALGVDRAGLSPSGRMPVTAARASGALLTIVAVAIASIGRVEGEHALALGAAALALLPLIAGAGTSVQQAFNARVAVVGGPWGATWINFAVGTSVLVCGLALSLLAPGHLGAPPTAAWLYLGGALGVVFVAAATTLVRMLGVLLFSLASVAGQVIAALVIDLVSAREHVALATVLGAVVTLAGVAIAALSQWRARGEPRA